MLHLRKILLICSVFGVILSIGSPAPATPVAETYVGTWSGTPRGANPGGLAQGGKFVIDVSYDTNNIEVLPSPAEDDRAVANGGVIDPTRYFSAQLTGADFQLSVPLEGFSTITTQTGSDHFPLGPGFAPTAEIQFFNTAGTQFRGFEFESDFLPGTTSLPGGGLIFEIFTADTNFGSNPVTNSVAQIINGDNAFGTDITSTTVDVRSEDNSASGGQQNPGVFLSEGVPVIAEAEASPLANYNASTLTLTTNAGTALVTDTVDPIVPGQVRTAPSSEDDMPRQADNDLGAARTDGEDFLTYDWTVDGISGEGDQTGTRLNRVVTSNASTPLHYENDGTRTVDNVNIEVAIEDSGLAHTTDSTTWDVQVTEDITGLTSTDSVTVSYDNALPTIANASATAQGLDLQFDLEVADLDLAVNSLIPGFENLMIDILVDGADENLFFSALLAGATNIGGSQQLVSNADLISQFGLGLHTFRVDAEDLAGASVFAEFDFTVLGTPPNPIPEPGTLVLLATGLAGLGVMSRRRRKRD